MQKEGHNTRCGADAKPREPSLTAGGKATQHGHWKAVWLFLTKRNTFLYGSTIALLSIYQKELKAYIHTQICRCFIGALFIIAKTWEKPRCPSVGEWISKLWSIQTVEYYSALRINEQLSPWGCRGALNERKWKKPRWKGCVPWSQLYDILDKAELWRQ